MHKQKRNENYHAQQADLTAGFNKDLIICLSDHRCDRDSEKRMQ